MFICAQMCIRDSTSRCLYWDLNHHLRQKTPVDQGVYICELSPLPQYLAEKLKQLHFALKSDGYVAMEVVAS